MGWERKRGKLHELNALLRGSTTTSFLTTGRTASTPPTDVRYVVTLDADTRCRAASSGDLVGTMAHPLNRPTLRPATRPRRRRLRRAPAAHHADAARRARRVDLPADLLRARPASTRTRRRSPTSTRTSSRRAASPARGSTTSTRSSAALADRVPENALLSHDLFEGIFARAGLVTDVELFDEFPSHYLVAAAAPAPLGARRLAAPALDPRTRRATPRAGAAGARSAASAAGRCSTTSAGRCRRRSRWPPSSPPGRSRRRRPGVWTAFVVASCVVPAALPVARRADPAPAGHLEAQPPPRRRRRRRRRRGAGRCSASRSSPIRRG